MAARTGLLLMLLALAWNPFPVLGQTRSPDFDQDGTVDLEDFFLFAGAYGSRNPADLARFDLDGGGTVDIQDFFLFAADFGKSLTPAAISVPLATGVAMEMVWIAPGTFWMGSDASDPLGSAAERPRHQVTITKGFYLAKHEVTQEQWTVVMGTSLPWSKSAFVQLNPKNPAVYLAFDEAQKFIGRLNLAARDSLYRLPTEAEWEYACRAGTSTRWSFGDEETRLADHAWYDGNTVNVGQVYAHAVGIKQPNPWGLCDMHGNVWEWTQDWYGPYPGAPQTDPAGSPEDLFRVIRGGSFINGALDSRSAQRRELSTDVGRALGMRVLRRR